jgi:hypothetical protein
MWRRLKGFQLQRKNILKTGCQATKNIYMIIDAETGDYKSTETLFMSFNNII